MIVMLLLLSGCANTPVDNFCLWAKPITISQEELAGAMSMETLRQIDNYNQEWEARCGNRSVATALLVQRELLLVVPRCRCSPAESSGGR